MCTSTFSQLHLALVAANYGDFNALARLGGLPVRDPSALNLQARNPLLQTLFGLPQFMPPSGAATDKSPEYGGREEEMPVEASTGSVVDAVLRKLGSLKRSIDEIEDFCKRQRIDDSKESLQMKLDQSEAERKNLEKRIEEVTKVIGSSASHDAGASSGANVAADV